MKAVVLIGEKGPSGEQFVRDIRQYSDDEFVLKRYGDVGIGIKNGEITAWFLDDGTDFSDVRLVYLRGMTDEALRHALALYLKAKGIAVVNSESDRFQTMTKLEQCVALALAGIPVPNSVFLDRRYYGEVPALLNAGFPLVAKSIGGKNGADNVLVASSGELENLDIPSPIFQSFLPNNFDYRVIVTGDKVALSYRRVRAADSRSHKNNVAGGATREMTDLPSDLQGLAVKAAKAVGREFTGLDILTNSKTGKSVVLEVNFNFGTPEFDDEATKRSYYEQIAGYFKRLAR